MKAEKRDFLRLDARPRLYKQLNIEPLGVNLNLAMRAQLPVPNGIVLPQTAWRRLIADNFVEVAGEDVLVNGADVFLKRLALDKLKRPVAVRGLSSACPEPIEVAENDHLHIAPTNTETIITTIVAIWQSGQTALVHDALQPQQRGSIHLLSSAQTDHIQLANGKQFALARLSRWQRPTAPQAWQRRLQQLIRGVARTFADANWSIQFVDDGEVCWLWALQPSRG